MAGKQSKIMRAFLKGRTGKDKVEKSEKIENEERVKIETQIKTKKQSEIGEEARVEVQSSGEKSPFLVLQELEREEAALVEEKRDLAALRERLELRTGEEIEVKERSIQTLKSEVAELKRQCAEIGSAC